jgi:hypothetical protein
MVIAPCVEEGPTSKTPKFMRMLLLDDSAEYACRMCGEVHSVEMVLVVKGEMMLTRLDRTVLTLGND